MLIGDIMKIYAKSLVAQRFTVVEMREIYKSLFLLKHSLKDFAAGLVGTNLSRLDEKKRLAMKISTTFETLVSKHYMHLDKFFVLAPLQNILLEYEGIREAAIADTKAYSGILNELANRIFSEVEEPLTDILLKQTKQVQ